MSFEIYFDESHKMDKYTSNYSYYGVIGWNHINRKKFEEFMKENKITSELHFTKFNLDKVDKYLKAVEFALDKIDANFYIVNTQEALKICSKIGIDEGRLRKLFYIKIPERLIYGMTRRLERFKNVDIYIDKSDEYGSDSDKSICNEKFVQGLIKLSKSEDDNKIKLINQSIDNLLEHIQLPKTLKFELNAQSLYRGLNYSINKVRQIDSNESKSLQIIDVLLGIIGFLFEEQYLEPNEKINKSDMERILNDFKISEEEKEFFKKCYMYRKYKKSGEEKYELQIKKDDYENTNRLKELNKKMKVYSKKHMQKAEFIYRLLNNDDTLSKFYNLSTFLWSNNKEQYLDSEIISKSNEKEVTRAYLSRYMAKFFKFKTEYDNFNRLKILKFHKEQVLNKKQETKLKENDYKDYLGFGTSLKVLVRRYLKELNIETI